MTSVSQAVQWIRGEYLELPRLNLTRPQVQRLWNLDETTSDAVLAALVDVNFLAKTPDGRYVRSDIMGVVPRRHASRPRRRAA